MCRKTVLRLRSALVGIVSISIFFGAYYYADARAEIDVTWKRSNGAVFRVYDIAPGESVQRAVAVKNIGDTQDLYMRITNLDGKSLAKYLSVHVIDRKTGRYYIGKSGEGPTLEKLSGKKNILIERLNTGEKGRYIIKIVFDKNATNELQGVRSTFDMSLGFSGEPVAENNTLSYKATFIQKDDDGDVLGVQTEYHGAEDNMHMMPDGRVLPAYTKEVKSEFPWLIILIGYAIAGVMTVFTKYVKKFRSHTHTPMIVFVMVGIGLSLVWYFVEYQHLYIWFPIGVCIIMLGVIFVRRRLT